MKSPTKISKLKFEPLLTPEKEKLQAERIFKILKPYASEYRKLEQEYGLLPEYFHFTGKRGVGEMNEMVQ